MDAASSAGRGPRAAPRRGAPGAADPRRGRRRGRAGFPADAWSGMPRRRRRLRQPVAPGRSSRSRQRFRRFPRPCVPTPNAPASSVAAARTPAAPRPTKVAIPQVEDVSPGVIEVPPPASALDAGRTYLRRVRESSGWPKIELGGIVWSEEEPRALLNDRIVGRSTPTSRASPSRRSSRERVALEKDGMTIYLVPEVDPQRRVSRSGPGRGRPRSSDRSPRLRPRAPAPRRAGSATGTTWTRILPASCAAWPPTRTAGRARKNVTISELWPAEPGPRARRCQARRRVARLLEQLPPRGVDRVLRTLVADRVPAGSETTGASSGAGTPRRGRSRLGRSSRRPSRPREPSGARRTPSRCGAGTPCGAPRTGRLGRCPFREVTARFQIGDQIRSDAGFVDARRARPARSARDAARRSRRAPASRDGGTRRARRGAPVAGIP